ncbi:MAG TPA: type II toxin-antitoxin system HicB family antitoxin [Pirellulales bacterium]|jgi:predicted HicB family RNase H-like nuclease|nr:type II toxin-antitoxin system HicB family antitoxin [Pirellulales bacterium]
MKPIAKGKKASTIKVQATCKTGPYKGYFGHAEYDADAGIFHGDVIGTRDVITFEGKTIEDLNKEFCESIEDYLDMCKENGRPPERPFSGNFVVRIPPELHKRASRLAEARGVSLNALVTELIEDAASEKQPKRLRKKQA